MLRLMQYEELAQLLLGATDVLGAFRRQDPGFEARALAWLGDVEEALRNNRLGLSATVAAARTQLIAGRAGRGRAVRDGQRPTRSARLSETVGVVRSTVEQLTEELRATRARLDEADALARQVLALGAATGVLSGGMGEAECFARLRADPHTAGGIVQLLALVGAQDALVVIGRQPPVG